MSLADTIHVGTTSAGQGESDEFGNPQSSGRDRDVLTIVQVRCHGSTDRGTRKIHRCKFGSGEAITFRFPIYRARAVAPEVGIEQGGGDLVRGAVKLAGVW